MVATQAANAATTTSSGKVVTMTSSKPPTFSGKHGDDWTMWEMKMTAHLMDKGLNKCLKPSFKSRLPANESRPFYLATEDGRKAKEAVDLNKKGDEAIHSSILDNQSVE
jgi:hypothetical protein